MIVPKNLKFFKNKNGMDLEIKWEFNLQLKKIQINYFYFNSSKVYKILYNEKVIKEEKYNYRCKYINFCEDNHYYQISLDICNSKLFIDGKSFDELVEEDDKNNIEGKEKDNEKDLKYNEKEKKILSESESKEESVKSSKESEESKEESEEENKKEKESKKKVDKINKNFEEIEKKNEEENVYGLTLSKSNENSSFFINIKFFNIENIQNYTKKELSGLLNLFLIKYMADFFDNKILENISPEKINNIKDISNIILKLQNNIDFTNDNKEDIKLILKEKKGNNILIYSQYVNMLIKSLQINDLIKYLKKEDQNKINKYWGCLSNYEEFNSFFEEEFQKDLKNTYFDYSLISLAVLEKNEEEEDYKKMRDSCPNVIKRILYHGSQIEPISSILIDDFKYTRKAFFGMGIYFSDIIDYISFYCGGSKLSNRRDNFGKTIPVNSTFSFIASEVFYDYNKFKQIEDFSLYVPELNYFPTYEDLKEKYKNKMVEKDGIHFIKVKNDGKPLSEKDFLSQKRMGKFVGSEYAITEKYQIFPIYSLTLKRNEYFVLWRDPNFFNKNKFSEFLNDRKSFCYEKANMNIYFENSMEDALKFLSKRKYNKVILISNIGKDLSGKKFVEIARKILGFNLMVLFFSNNKNHFNLIQKFPNCLYTSSNTIYEKYISNFNEKGLKSLKTEVEKKYNIKLLDFSNDFLSYPYFMDEVKYSSLTFKNYNSNFRHVKICCENNDSLYYLSFNENIDNIDDCSWYVTIIDDEITFFSNEKKYLDVSKDNESITSSEYMIVWKFGIINDLYYFKYPLKKSNNILSIVKGGKFKVNQNSVGDMELFKLIDIINIK